MKRILLLFHSSFYDQGLPTSTEFPYSVRILALKYGSTDFTEFSTEIYRNPNKNFRANFRYFSCFQEIKTMTSPYGFHKY